MVIHGIAGMEMICTRSRLQSKQRMNYSTLTTLGQTAMLGKLALDGFISHPYMAILCRPNVAIGEKACGRSPYHAKATIDGRAWLASNDP